MRVLVACEESQAVCIEFRKLGHEAYSCDIQDCSGGHPEWHFQIDVFEAIKLMDWDLMIAFPPCTHLSLAGAMHFKKKIADGRQQEAINFFIKLRSAPINKIAIENPINIMGKFIGPPQQVIQPYYFGDQFQKTTWIWLKNLPLLYHSSEIDLFEDKITHVGKGEFVTFVNKKTQKVMKQPKWYADAFFENRKGQGIARSKTFPGIAKAMAEQWGGKL